MIDEVQKHATPKWKFQSVGLSHGGWCSEFPYQLERNKLYIVKMHESYEEEESKQRQLKAIINKLTSQNVDELIQQIIDVKIDSAVTLCGLVSQIFEKALTEPTLCETYVNICHHLARMLPDFSEENQRITVKRLLLSKCQEEFEKGEREEAEAKSVVDGEIKCSYEERMEKKVQAQSRMLGNIQLIGELYKKRMLTERIMHECIKKLLGQHQNPDEEHIEALCKLMSRIGEMIDHPKAKKHVDAYFDIMQTLSNHQNLSSRLRSMLRDVISLRRNKWQQMREDERLKMIEEVQKGTAPERQLESGDWYSELLAFVNSVEVLHADEKRYRVVKVHDKEEAKKRQLKAILNKLAPQNFEKLTRQVGFVSIDNAVTLACIVSHIIDTLEPFLCQTYASFCQHLDAVTPHLYENNQKITFKKLLVNKCQQEFEREEAEDAGVEELSEHDTMDKKIKVRKRRMVNIQFIGELYKKGILTQNIIHSCMMKLLLKCQSDNEEDVEAMCILICVIGKMIDHSRDRFMDAYFDKMVVLLNNQKRPCRAWFMLKDTTDLRNNKWHQRRKFEWEKRNEELHIDIYKEPYLFASRLSHGGYCISSTGRGQHTDYPQGLTTLSSIKFKDRHPFESTFSVPSRPRPVVNCSTSVGSQGGLTSMIPNRQHSLMSSSSLVNASPSTGDPRRMISGLSEHIFAPKRTPHFSQNKFIRNYILNPGRSLASPSYDQLSSQECNKRDPRTIVCSFGRSMETSPATSSVQGSSVVDGDVLYEYKRSEVHLRDMSIAAIREYYCARDEEEVRLCIKDLNAPGFHPKMVMLWIVDSFDHKNDIDRDFLAKLLVSLCKSQDSLLSQVHLTTGIEFMLSNLEDAVIDTPKAALHLGRILGLIIVENVATLREIGKLILEGGLERGHLIQTGLGSDLLISILDTMRRERGKSGLNDIWNGSNLQLEDFRPRDSRKSITFDAFVEEALI